MIVYFAKKKDVDKVLAQRLMEIGRENVYAIV